MSAAQGGERLFGTDGVRGLANVQLTPELALRLGRAGAFVLARRAPSSRVAIGRDTRVSGPMLAAALAAGAMSVGADVIDLGVFPTPGVALLSRLLPASAGAVVSASHNPFADNGVKFFAADGAKLDEEREDEIGGHALAEPDGLPRPEGRGVGRLVFAPEAREAYLEHVAATVTARLDGLRVVVDCANGSMSGLAREALERLGAKVTEIFAAPDGFNINEGSGSTHPEAMSEAVTRLGADVGLAFDGDGDRVVAADGRGRILDGDEILAVCGLDLLSRGVLPGRAIAATVMSNLALDLAFRDAGGTVVRTPVGDRQVYLAMRQVGLALGGEQAGHVIFLDHSATGDGLITALQLLDTVARRGARLDEAPGRLERFPQVQRAVRFAGRAGLGRLVGSEGVQAACRRIESRLAGQGRVVLRPSGTEPVIRIMVEARDAALASALAGELEEVVRREAGAP